ncbi:hypothetical protein ILUMI_20320 [Ignelater luminosus]|uniref:Cytochrome P450 n=1 Tax=Ignelater luminosus TaxID=2038154 RepID=A0A8K0G4Z6_IGNLU|nr:hypothetical protein ILUMI_20320 [Ignelater luminosus]
MFWFLVFGGLAAIFIYYAFINPFKYWERMGVPQDHVWRIWLNTVLALIQYRPISDSLKILYDGFPGKRYSGMYNLYSPSLSIRDPELIKQITVKDFDHFVDHFNFFATNDEPLWSKNLFFLKGKLMFNFSDFLALIY